jgi:hypothetical protein
LEEAKLNPAFYFECDPWTKTVEQARQGVIGELRVVGVEATFAPGQTEQIAAEWVDRINDLLDAKPLELDRIGCEMATSILMRYPDGVIVRLFLDTCESCPNENFELVGRDGLIIWNPSIISVLDTSSETRLSCSHPYAVSMRGARL